MLYPLLLDTTYRSSGTETEYWEEEEAEAIAETKEQYMSKTRTDYGSGVARPKIEAAIRWIRNEPTGLIKTWEDLKTKFLNKYCLTGRTAKKMEEINNLQQEPDETIYQAWESFKELLIKYPQHYLTEMHETAADAKKNIQEMAKYSQKWHNGTSRGRSTETFDRLAAIQAQLNNLGREIKKVNEKVYVAQVRCEQCKGPHYTKDFPLKEEGETLKEAYYMQSMEDTLSKYMSESAKRHEENSNLIKEIRASTDAAIRNQ
ncbi:hypothetical protein Tco_0561272 [Tanacetum coccineum]